jgi:hypothetical protein
MGLSTNFLFDAVNPIQEFSGSSPVANTLLVVAWMKSSAAPIQAAK